MPSRKRNLEKIEAIARASNEDAPTEPRGEAAKYLRALVAQANRGELKVKPATEERKSKTWLESEVEKVANRLSHPARIEGATVMAHDPCAITVANQTSADEETTDELLARLLRQTRLVSGKVH